MNEMLDRICRAGWLVAEAGLLVVVLCLLLNIILGAESSGAFVSSVATNANAFLLGLPSGSLMGLVLIVVAYWLIKPRLAR
jgi:hypothetical protein